MDYEPIDRRTSNFHVIYTLGGPTTINEIKPDGKEEFRFANHDAQVDFLGYISDREGLTDEKLDEKCRLFLEKICGR